MNKPTKEPGRLERHLRRRIVSGFFVIVPLWITFEVLKLVFRAMDSVLVPLLDDIPLPFDVPDKVLAIAAVMIFLFAVYLIGVITAYVIGRRLVAVGERLIMKIPVVKSIYAAVKQVVETFSISEKA